MYANTYNWHGIAADDLPERRHVQLRHAWCIHAGTWRSVRRL